MPKGQWDRSKKPTVCRISDTEDIVIRDNSLYLRVLGVGNAQHEVNLKSTYMFFKEMFTTDWRGESK